MDKRTVTIISGPLGVGKTTIAKKVAEITPICGLVEGDTFFRALESVRTLDWNTRLELAWKNIVNQTKLLLEKEVNVVIDFVVETELKWFCDELEHFSPEIFYIVLITDKDTIAQRLEKRGDLKYLDRSLRLLSQLSQDPENKEYLYDTTGKAVDLIASEIAESQTYRVPYCDEDN